MYNVHSMFESKFSIILRKISIPISICSEVNEEDISLEKIGKFNLI